MKEIDEDDNRKITDIICLHNYDYDKFLTEEKVKSIISSINGRIF